MATKRGFGELAKLPSGNWRARYVGPDAVRHSAPHTFTAKADAEAWLTDERRLIERDEWVAPARRQLVADDGTPAAQVTLAKYARTWLAQSRARESTKVLYERLLRLHILPTLGKTPLPAMSRPQVAAWWRALDHDHERTCNLAYSLLRTVLYSAVDDGLIDVSPCRVKGAGRGSRRRSVEPPSPAQVQAIADAMPARWRLGVLLGSWCALRSGEVRELRRKDIDIDKGVIRVERGVTRAGSRIVVGAPKTEAGRRTVVIPGPILADVRRHLRDHAQVGADGLLFWDADTGAQPHDGRWVRAFNRACKEANVSGLRFHDLRHAGLTYAAVAGATIRELQQMAGHTTAAMAMRYQEVAADHMAEVVGRLGEVIESGRKPPTELVNRQGMQ